MDALIHEEVMGWPKSPIFGVYEYPDGGYDFAPPYSTDIAAAWPVVEKLERDGFNIELIFTASNGWSVTIDKGNIFGGSSGQESTVQHLICLAALKAVGKGE